MVKKVHWIIRIGRAELFTWFRIYDRNPPIIFAQKVLYKERRNQWKLQFKVFVRVFKIHNFSPASASSSSSAQTDVRFVQ